MNARAVALGLAVTFAAGVNGAIAGTNDFFGSNLGGADNGGQGSAAAPMTAPTSAPPGDYTVDEKRMQKKFKANLKDAKALVAKAEKMSKDKDQKIAKKGKILKEIGEKRLAELQQNNPFPELAARDKKIH
jgi:hypothetical protein